MKGHWVLTVSAGLFAAAPAFAIDAKYAAKLERSGCTQVSELQGCDIDKTREENAQAGFGPAAAAPAAELSPLAGNWKAVDANGATVAEIHIDDAETVWVDGNEVTARRGDGALVFQRGAITYALQTERSASDLDAWSDAAAGTRGRIVPD